MRAREAQSAARAPPEPADVAGATGGGAGAYDDDDRSSRTQRSSWSALAVAELRARLEIQFDPLRETLPQYQGRVVRAVSLLEAKGELVPEGLLDRLATKAQYAGEVANMQDADAVRHLRAQLARTLEEEDTPGNDLRAEILVDMIASRSPWARYAFAATIGHSFFGGPGIGRGSGAGSPDRRR